MNRICKYCNEQITNPVKNQLYHKDCSKLKRNVNSRERMRKIYQCKTQKQLTCICGKIFTPQNNNNNQKYCCASCYRTANNNKAIERYKLKNVKPMEHSSGWAIPQANPLPRYNKLIHRIFYEIGNGR